MKEREVERDEERERRVQHTCHVSSREPTGTEVNPREAVPRQGMKATD